MWRRRGQSPISRAIAAPMSHRDPSDCDVPSWSIDPDSTHDNHRNQYGAVFWGRGALTPKIRRI